METDEADLDASPTEQWLHEVLDPCEDKSPSAREGFIGWIRSSLSFNTSRSESFNRLVSENEADHDNHPKDELSPQDDAIKEDCPDLAPYALSDNSKENHCSFLLQGKEEDGDRPRCWLLLLALSPFGTTKSVKQLLGEANEVCSQCRQSLLLHRGVYMCGERRVLLTFLHESGKNSWLRCRECRSKWTVPQERLLQLPASVFFSLLWFCPKLLPCGHTFASSCWEVSNALFEVRSVEVLELELRGPAVQGLEETLKTASTSSTKTALKDELTALLQRAEKLVESHLSNVLRDFRQVGPGGQVPKKNAWFWNQSDERALKCALRSRCLLEASSILRRCATKLQAWPIDATPLVDLGITCHLHNCLAECYHLLDHDLEGPPVDSDSEHDSEPERDQTSQNMEVSTMSRGLTPKVIAKGKLSRRCTDIGFAMPSRTKARSLSAPPKFGIQEEQRCRDEGKSLDDSSLESLLHPLPRLASMDPRMILKRFYASLVGEGREDTEAQPVTTRAISSSSTGIGTGDTWPVLCAEPRRLLESAGHAEPYDLSVPCGIHGMAVPLPASMEKTDDLGAMIAHALLSSQHWEELRPRLLGHGLLDDEDGLVRTGHQEIDFCSINDEETPIPISVKAPDGSQWQVEVLAPLRFHLLRRLAFRNDANFCEMLRRCDPHTTTGGKSKSAFWKSQCGQLMLKQVRAAEAGHLASKAGPFAVRLAEALRGEPSLLCEVFGLFKVSRLGKRASTRTIIIMRNLLNGIDDDWQIFDIKGAAHRRMPAMPTGPTLEVPMGSPRPSSSAPSSPVSAVKWDDSFVETSGALPKVLKPTDHEALELALKCDLHVLRELGLVDYSLLMAFHSEGKRVRLAIIDFLQPYTLNKQLESTVKKLVQRHEPTIVEPVQYAKRFHEFIRKAFQAAVGKTEVI